MSTEPLRIGLSPCPNDTYLFHALLHGLVDTGDTAVEPVVADVERLNELMLAGELPVTKASFAAVARCIDRYAVLRAGGALGRGNGPLVIAREPLAATDVAGRSVALPGDLTTAAALFRACHPGAGPDTCMRYDEVPRALERGDVDVAVIIHELRFSYAERGFELVEDLGVRWEAETGLPVPLGGIFVRRDHLPRAGEIENWLRSSFDLARRDPDASRAFVRRHAQEMADAVIDAHVATYVTDETRAYTEEGERAIVELLRRAGASGVTRDDVFAGDW